MFNTIAKALSSLVSPKKEKWSFNLTGIVHLQAWNKQGEKIFDEIWKNLIVNAWLAEVTNLLWNVSTPTEFTYLATGSDATAAAAAQTTLVSENSWSWSDRAAATVTQETTSVSNDTLQLLHTFNFSGAITVSEVGIFNAASSGDMLARYIPTSDTFGNGDSLQITYQIVAGTS